MALVDECSCCGRFPRRTGEIDGRIDHVLFNREINRRRRRVSVGGREGNRYRDLRMVTIVKSFRLSKSMDEHIRLVFHRCIGIRRYSATVAVRPLQVFGTSYLTLLHENRRRSGIETNARAITHGAQSDRSECPDSPDQLA